jgi:nucleoside-diphosphate-sugar epimerase
MILVTGGTGLSGSFVVQELHRRGYPVSVLARSPASDTPETPGVKHIQGDLTDQQSLRRACEGVIGIVHAACTFTDSNVDISAMQALLEGWQEGPFIFFSSLDVYGLSTAPFITEEEPLDESYNDYARGKIVCERLLSKTARQQGRTDYTILRAPHIWAPHPKAYRRLMDKLGKSATLVLPGATEEEWSQYRDAWIDARDLAWLVAECLQHPLGGAVNILSDHFTWHDLVTQLIRLTGSDRQLVHKPLADITEEELPNKHFYAQKWRYSDQRIREALGYRPTYNWQTTVAEVIKG